MVLQPVPYQYSPRTFQNIEERLRRLERRGAGAWTDFQPVLPGFTLGTGGVARGAYRLGSGVAEVTIRARFGPGATTTSGQDTQWTFQLPQLLVPDISQTYPDDIAFEIPAVWSINSEGVFPGTFRFPNFTTVLPAADTGYVKGGLFVERAQGSGGAYAADLIIASAAWAAIGTPPADSAIFLSGTFVYL